MQISSDSSSIELNVTSDVVLSLLTFIYTGELNLHPSDQLPVTNLAEMLELHTLKDACSRLIIDENLENLQNDDNDIFDDKCDMEVTKLKDEFVESKLDMKEIWGESSDSESEIEGQGHGSDMGNHGNSSSEIDNEEYHDIMCTQKQHLKKLNISEMIENERLETEKDVKMDENEINEKVILCNSDGVENENIEIDKDDGYVQTDNSRIDKKQIELLDLTLDSGPEQTDSEAEQDKMPSPKRIRYSSEKDDLEIRQDTSVGNLNNKNKLDGVETIADSPDKVNANEESKLNRSNHVETNAKAMNVSTPGFNNSSADLFGSPSPRVGSSFVTKPYKCIDRTTPIVESETIKSSTPIECQSPTFSKKLKQNLNNDSLFITPVPISRQTNKSKCLVGQDLSTHKLDTISTNASHIEQKSLLNSFEELDNISKNYSTDNCDKKDDDDNDSDDDLEITGDNFDDISQHSPTFKDLRSKTKSKTDATLVSPSAEMSRTVDGVTDKAESADSIEAGDGDISHYFDESFSAMDGVITIDIDHDDEHNEIGDNSNCDDRETVKGYDNINIDNANQDSGVTNCSNKPSGDREVTFDTAVNLVESDNDKRDSDDSNNHINERFNDLEEDVIELKSNDCDTRTPQLNSKSDIKSLEKANDVKRKSMHGKHEISVYDSDDNNDGSDENVDRNQGYDQTEGDDGHDGNQLPNDTEQGMNNLVLKLATWV